MRSFTPLLGETALLAAALLPGLAQAALFSPADYQASVSVAASNYPGPKITRETTANGSVSEAIDFASNGSGSARAALALEASSGAASVGSSLYSGGNGMGYARSINRFMVVPREGFTGSNAFVSLDFLLAGWNLVSCAGVCFDYSAQAGISGRVFVEGFEQGPGRFDFSQDLRSLQNGQDRNNSDAVNRAWTFEGMVPVNTPILVDAYFSAHSTTTQERNGPSASSWFSFSYGLAGQDASAPLFDIVWASDLHFPQPPAVQTVPVPAPAWLLPGGLAALARLRKRRA